jgi:hypothetical protein
VKIAEECAQGSIGSYNSPKLDGMKSSERGAKLQKVFSKHERWINLEALPYKNSHMKWSAIICAQTKSSYLFLMDLSIFCVFTLHIF